METTYIVAYIKWQEMQVAIKIIEINSINLKSVCAPTYNTHHFWSY